MYINTQTLTQHSEQDIRRLNPNTSYPFPFPTPTGYEVVFTTPQPTLDAATQAAREVTPVLTSKGTWEQAWEVVAKYVDYTTEEGVVVTAAEQQAAAEEVARLASVPPSVSMAKARAVLITGGHMASITAALDAMTGIEGEVARSNWEFATTVDRDDPLTQSLATALGLTDLQMDALFIAAGASATTTTQGTT
jgi:hypothetical protein